MKVKVVKKKNNKESYSQTWLAPSKSIIIPVDVVHEQNIKILIEAQTPDAHSNCIESKEVENCSAENSGAAPSWRFFQIFKVIFTKAENLIKKEHDGALIARAASTSIMRVAGWLGYAFAVYMPIGTIRELIETFTNWNLQFVVQSSISFALSMLISIFVAVLSKGLMVDAIIIERKQKSEQTYGIATLIATILIGILTR